MHAPVRTTPPALTPVTLTEVKAHCRVDGSDSDAVLTAFLNAAVDHLDGWSGILGRCLVTQTWRQDFDGFARIMRLPLGPVASITSITSRNAAGQIATVSSSDYALKADALGHYVRFKDGFVFPSDLNQVSAVSVTYVAGTAPAEVPASIKAALLLLVGNWHENREAVTAVAMSELPMAVNALLTPHRRVMF